MKKIFSLLLASFLLLSSSALIFAQEKPAATPQTSATPPVEEDNDVVKISTALIQLDVVVTDKSGKLVTDLKPEDFEISENGERQTVTNLSYFSGHKFSLTDENLNVAGISNQPMPTVGEVRRTVGIVVDDAGLSAQSINLVKKELIKFISEQVQPNDLVAIIKTSGSVGILQQFTTDKKKLAAIVDNLKFQPLTSSGLSPFEPISISFAEQIQANSGGELAGKSKAISEQRGSIEFLSNINKNIVVTRGALGVLNSTISAMSRLPGRKSVLYVAEGVYSLFTAGIAGNVGGGAGIAGSINSLGGTASIFTDSRELQDKLRGITEIANRATISVYALDPRGTAPINFSASDNLRGGMSDRESGGRNDDDLTARNNAFKSSQQGLKFLAEETSGKAFLNTNDLGKSLKDTLDSQNGYYIVAYQPDADTFNADKRRFNKLNVKVKRPNVNVTFRSGFFNVAETAEEKITASPENAFLQKLFSPYKYDEINLQMAAIFAADEQTATIRAFVGIAPKNLQFTDTADGNKTANLDIVAVSFNENGIPVSQVAKRFDIKVPAKGYEKLVADGIALNLAFAAKPQNSQQIKIAVRDVNSNKIGTASQTINLPNFDKRDLNLSGIVMQNYTPEEWKNLQSGKPPTDTANRMQADTAQRKFKKGTILSFNYAVYAAPSMRSKSQAQFTVFKDGRELFKGAPEDVPLAPTGKMQRVNRGGAFLLGTEMTAGKYVLQIAVGGDAIKEPQTQTIDFELVN
ncbi:MAG: VWA domain-containing protein [Pyrinomonadaceae bacterium]|nr:VWA domain-containing protein [Pyrinomonadaceae bacterium]